MEALSIAPWWLPGGDLQTIAPALWGRHLGGAPALQRERWDTPDADFIDVDRYEPDRRAGRRQLPVLVLFHGLEGGSGSHYARAFARQAAARGWRLWLPHFRGCSGEINRAPRAYHSGDYEEIDWILKRVRAAVGPDAVLMAAGVSLGGNALLRWGQEAGGHAATLVSALAAISAPLDLMAAGHAIDRGLNRQIYARMFLRTMKRKARLKWAQFPGLFDLPKALGAKTLREFDHVFTAPLHGFAGVDDYWRRASAKPGLRDVRLPTLVLNARNDPFVPAHSLPRVVEVPAHVVLWQPAQGGHVGFAVRRGASSGLRGAARWRGDAMSQAVCDWLASAAGVEYG